MFDILELVHKRIILLIADARFGENVVAVIMITEVLPELLDLPDDV
jgi:hypothetical protein